MTDLRTLPACTTCLGSGELPTDFGPRDCPDCGGAGTLPSKSTLIDWRARDIERAHTLANGSPVASDVAWLVAELRSARGALNEIIALAHDIEDENEIARRIRFVANRALGTYVTVDVTEGAPTPNA
jgi:hypothetical protein